MDSRVRLVNVQLDLVSISILASIRAIASIFDPCDLCDRFLIHVQLCTLSSVRKITTNSALLESLSNRSAASKREPRNAIYTCDIPCLAIFSPTGGSNLIPEGFSC